MKVIVTGASGFLGHRTCEKLIEDHRITKITAAARTLREWRQIDNPKINYIYGDLTEKHYIKNIIGGMDAIVHVAALSSVWGPYENFYKANVLVTRMLIDECRKQGVKRFVFISTPAVYNELRDRLDVKESDPFAKKFINAYAKTKWEAEQLVRKSGLDYIILRPRAIFGKGDTVVFPRLLRAHEEGKLMIMGNGENKVDLVPVCNVADSITLALFVEGKGLNEDYNIANGAPIKIWQKLPEMMQKMGLEPPKKRVPVWLVLLLARFFELKSKLTDKSEPALTVYGVSALVRSFTIDISKARELLGYEPKLSFDQAVDEFIEWYYAFYKNK